MTIEDAKRKHEARLLSLPGVVSVGIGLHEGHPAIMVGVETPEGVQQAGVPSTLEGHPVQTVVVGTPRAF